MEIDWGPGNMGGPNNCVSVNFYGQAAQTISQICALTVDNSDCGSDVQFIFPDTAQTYTIPAYSPSTTILVYTNQTQFFVSASAAQPQDITRFGVLNFAPPPVAVPISEEQDYAVFNNISATVVGSTQLIPAGVSGTLEVLSVTLQANSGASGGVLFTIQDGGGNVLAGSQGYSQSGANLNAVLLSLTNLRVRFQNGLKLVISSSGIASGSTLMANAYYRSP